MARPLRIEFPGAVYHVMSRGNARQPIYTSDKDRRLFLETLSQMVTRFNFLCHAYCLMENHYHALLETPDGNLSLGMRHLNGVYTQLFNRSHRRVGHLFQGRYKAILVEKEKYLLSLCRYIALNAVKVGIALRPEDYQWSSYRYTAGHDKSQDYLSIDWVLAQFGQDRASAQKRYRQFVLSGDEENPFDKVKGQSILGTDTFVSRFIDCLWEKEEIKEIPRKERYAGRPPLEALFAAEAKAKGPERDEVICEAALEYGYTLKEIADFLDLHYTTVSKVINRDKERLTKK